MKRCPLCGQTLPEGLHEHELNARMQKLASPLLQAEREKMEAESTTLRIQGCERADPSRDRGSRISKDRRSGEAFCQKGGSQGREIGS